jgi:CHRD domain-containing protein
MRKLMLVAALGALAMLVVLPAVGSAASTTLTAKLAGKNETPDKGDPDGTGTATIKIDPAKGTVCYTIKLKKIGATIAGHIHTGKKGKAGGVLIPLFGTTSSKTTRTGCARNQSASTLRKILRNPGNYYVNVHTSKFPNGAARGQLEKPGD